MQRIIDRRSVLQHVPLLMLVALLFGVATHAAALQGPPPTPPPFRSTVQINSTSEFNETAHWGGPDDVDLTIPVLTCYFGCPMGPNYKDITVTVSTGEQTPAQMATAIANAINDDPELQERGVKAKAINDSVSISSPVGPPTPGTKDEPKHTGELDKKGNPNENRISATYFAR